MISMYKKMVGL